MRAHHLWDLWLLASKTSDSNKAFNGLEEAIDELNFMFLIRIPLGFNETNYLLQRPQYPYYR